MGQGSSNNSGAAAQALSFQIPVDKSKRRFLTIATSVTGGAAAAAVLVPFIGSMFPSERAKAAGAPVEVDISKLEPGQKLNVEWRGKVVWIINRPKEALASLTNTDNLVADPESKSPQQPSYATNKHRSIKPEIFVTVGLCTHLGCSPTYRPEIAPADLGTDWQGGFYCPCHGSKFDLAGRVYKGVPAPINLEIPPHKFLSDSKVVIGQDDKAA